MIHSGIVAISCGGHGCDILESASKHDNSEVIDVKKVSTKWRH